MRSVPLSVGLALVFTLGSLTACSKHKCEFEGKEEDYWKEIALVTEGAERCLSSRNPYGCDLEADRCTPTLNAVHPKSTQADVEKRYREALEKQGWKFEGEKANEDGSKIFAFSKGERDELMVAFGSSVLSGPDGVDVFMTRKPEKATGTMLDEYRKKAEGKGDAKGDAKTE